MDELLARQLPQSAEAEQAVIGSMLIDPECIPVVIEQLRPDDFYAEENRRIFETIYSMFNNAMRIDAVTVLDQLKSAGLYDDAGGRAYLMQLMDVTPTAAGVREYAAIVRDKSMLRAIADAGAEIQKLVVQLAEQGMAVIFISSEIDEMLRCCDRMVVLRDKKKVAELNGQEISEAAIMHYIAGGAENEPA